MASFFFAILILGDDMKKLIVPIICLLCILIVLLSVDKITDGLMLFLNQTTTNKIEINNNDYYKSNNYIFISNTDNFSPYGIEDILNIMYTIINSGTTDFTFYCPKEYTDCVNDMKEITKNKTLLTHLNNFVHPFNSFSSIEASISDSGEIIIKVNYLYTKEEIEKIDAKVNELINTLVTPDITEDYDKIKTIHDYIINNTKYDLENRDETKSYTAYGPLFNGFATCNGYTDLMAIFLTKMGYDNYKVATTEETENTTEGHVWNAVKVNDEWLHLDLTWDDPVSSDGTDYLYHKYFLINSEELKTADANITSKDHVFDEAIYSELKTTNK